jgi:hypothetical protein
MNITTLKAELQGILHGTTLNKVTNIDGAINRAARKVLTDIDPAETIREVALGPIFDSVYDYQAPSDLKGNAIIDIKPQVNRTLRDRYPQTYSQEFDVMKEYTFQPNYNVNLKNGTKALRIDTPLINTGIVLTQADTLTGNDTWTGATFTVDNVNYASGTGAITFNLPAAASTTITDVFLQSVDLSTHLNQSTIGFYVYLPTASHITSLQLSLDSAAGSYVSPVIALTNEGLAFQDGWNFLTYEWKDGTTTGTPTTTITGIKVTFNTTAAVETGVKVNNFVSRLGQQMNIRYYSKCLFRDVTTNAFQETVTADTNLINLDTDSYNLLVCATALECIQQAFDGTATSDTDKFTKDYDSALRQYKQMYKTERNKPKVQYYRKPAAPWRKYFGRGYNL